MCIRDRPCEVCICNSICTWKFREQSINAVSYTHLDVYKRQQRGLPFDVKIPREKPMDVSTLTEEEFNAELEKGYADMKAGRVKDARQAFADIRKDYNL